MSLKLIVMRHAKSDWTDPFQDDHDRVLNPRGRASATALGKWLMAEQAWPDQLLCSSAARTQETWELVAKAGPKVNDTEVSEALYLARCQKMLNFLRRTGRGSTVILIGHNPGIGQMAQMLCAQAPESADFLRYPTGYSCIFEFATDQWADVDWGQGKLLAHVAARRLL